MTTERWRQIERVFEAVSGSPPDRRPAFLEEACAGDPELRQEVESLLACDAEDETFLRTPVAGAAERVAREQTAAIVGQRLGAWRITGVIGHGGMGAVYRAVRDDGQYDKEAALKVIRRGLASEADLRRFRRERQILARLDHPNIARLLDGGATDEGMPYLVMEYVEGQSITDYCRERSLPVEGRLRLFRQVCGAVQYAHQNLVVHRDLKPANILVTPDGAPKLLDFGIAKLLNPDEATDDLPPTFTTAWMLTPDYASPEQIRAENITPASDVYSLGAILYELLTGQRPHPIKGRSAGEIERVVCQQETQRPSTVAGSRHLRGDLDNIVLRAMRKESARRYGSVEQFSEDLRRHLEGLPVLARKDTVLYRTGKFLRRNRWPVAIGSVAAAGLIFATAVAVLQASRAQRQLTAVRDLAMTMLIDVNEGVRMLPGSVEARVIMVKKGLQYLDSLSRETGQDTALLWDLARGYEKIAALQASPDPAEPNLADLPNGLQSYRRALLFAEAVERARGRDQDLVLLLCRIHLGIGGLSPDTEEATRHLNESLRLSLLLGPGTVKFLGPEGPETGPYLQGLAWNLLGYSVLDSDPPKAIEYYSRAPRSLPPVVSRRSVPTPAAQSIQTAGALVLMGDLEGALAIAKNTLESLWERQANYPHENIRKRVMRVTWARIAYSVAGLQGSPFRMNLGDSASAVATCRRAITMLEGVLARDPSDAGAESMKLAALSTLGAVLSVQDPAESVKAYKQVLSSPAYPGTLAPFLPELQRQVDQTITDARWQISYPLRRLGRRHEALEEALRSVTERPVANAYNAAGDAQLDLGRPEAALEQYRMALAAAEKRASAVPKNMTARAELAGTYGHLGRYYESTRDWQAAREWYGKAHGVWANWTKAGGVSNPFVIRSEREMARAVARCDVRGKR